MRTFHRIEKIEHTLELDEKLSHQLKGWNVQRACSVLILTVIVLTTLGLFGNGWLSRKQLASGGATLQYEKFLRYEKEMTVTWRVSGKDEIELLIPMDYLDAFKIEKIIPESHETHLADRNVVYTFKVENGGEATIYFYLNPQKTGTVVETWQINGQDFKIAHFIYP
ncbi:hypothetical protein [Parapedobacter koreensis]|nr:hypothetical protein [Parapedobacter koreensis]